MSRPEAPPLPAQRLSDPVTPEFLNFGWERFGPIAREFLPLFQRHWRELALHQEHVPLDPDWDNYFRLDLQGVLRVLTARNVRGRLVGYVFNLVGPHLHYAGTPWAHTDMFWLASPYRIGWWGVRFMLENERGLREFGVIVHTVNFKLHFKDARVGKLFKRLGYTATDIVMQKML